METKYKIDKYIFNSNEIIGKGQYGTVFKGYNKHAKDGEPKVVALKQIDRKRVKSDETLLKDIETLEKIKGKFVVEYYACYKTPEYYYLAIEYFEGTNLEERLKKVNPLEPEPAKKVLKQICRAFLDIEEVVMHRDIKPENILEDAEGNIKLIDFGFAKILDPDFEYVKIDHTNGKGTPYYMSPQILGGKYYSCKTDIWSTGVTIFELMFCKFPWEADTPKEVTTEN